MITAILLILTALATLLISVRNPRIASAVASAAATVWGWAKRKCGGKVF